MRHTLVIPRKPRPFPPSGLTVRKPYGAAAACIAAAGALALALATGRAPDLALVALWAVPCLVIGAAGLRRASIRGLR